MKESRHLEIRNKRFRPSDILGISEFFMEQAQLSKKGDRNFNLSFILRCKDGTVYESERPEIFSEEGFSGIKPPQAIEMEFTDYLLQRRLSLTAVHGGKYSDRFSISGEDPKWVHDIFVRATEVLNALPPTDVWFTRHPAVTALLGQLGLGSLSYLAIFGLVELGIPLILADWKPSPETVEFLRQNLFVRIFFFNRIMRTLSAWILRWFLGQLPWLYFKEWLMKAYPSIELDFGPEHLKLAKIRRRRIQQFFAFIVAPIGVVILYDLIKALVTWPR